MLRILPLLLLLFVAAPAEAGHRLYPGHYPKAGPQVNLRIIDNLDNGGHGALNDAMNVWRSGTVLALTRERNGSVCGGATDGVVRVCDLSDSAVASMCGVPHAIGCAWLTYDGKHFRQGTVIVKGSYVRKSGRTALQKLFCHELGHAFNLAHRSDSNSCMKQGAGVSPTPDAHDKQKINRMHGRHNHSWGF